MTNKIQPKHLAQAIKIVDRMTIAEKTALMDAVFVAQPNLLLSLVALSKSGTPPTKLDVLLHVLLVTFEAMRASGKIWALIDEATQDRCHARVVAQIKFTEDLDGAFKTDAIRQTCEQVA